MDLWWNDDIRETALFWWLNHVCYVCVCLSFSLQDTHTHSHAQWEMAELTLGLNVSLRGATSRAGAWEPPRTKSRAVTAWQNYRVTQDTWPQKIPKPDSALVWKQQLATGKHQDKRNCRNFGPRSAQVKEKTGTIVQHQTWHSLSRLTCILISIQPEFIPQSWVTFEGLWPAPLTQKLN